MDRKRILIAGGSGFIGRALVREFLAQGFEVAVLTRSPRQSAGGAQELAWDGSSAGAWTASLDGAEAIINLTGKSINCPHTPENLREITDSRVNSVNAIAAAIRQVRLPPRVWVQASATGFYGDTGDTVCDEDTPAGNGTLAEICKKWEGAFSTAALTQTRKVCLRIGFVLGREGGALPVLCKMTRLFLGGAAGSGRQYVSWVHLTDLVAMFKAATVGEQFQGIFNAIAPNAVTNAELMRELRRVLHRPWSPPAPEFAVKLGARLMGSEGSLALASQRSVPRRFQEAGFPFRFSGLEEALKDLCAKP
jgi:hypothetical protein